MALSRDMIFDHWHLVLDLIGIQAEIARLMTIFVGNAKVTAKDHSTRT